MPENETNIESTESTESSGSILTSGAVPGGPESSKATETSAEDIGSSTEVKVENTEIKPETVSEANWAKSLPEDFEGLESLEKFKSLEDLAKGYVHAEKLIGREKIPMPETDEEMAAALKRLGAPETVEEYNLQLPADVDERYKEVFQQDLDWFGRAALEHNLTRKQVEGLFKSYSEYQGEVLESVNEANRKARSEAMTLIQREHGDNYEQAIHDAGRVLNEFGDEALKTTLDETGLGNHPGLVRMLSKIAPLIGEESSVDKAPAQTLAQLDAELNNAMAAPEYLDKSLPGHKQAKEKVTKLMLERYPN
jgi:hypothetical protein